MGDLNPELHSDSVICYLLHHIPYIKCCSILPNVLRLKPMEGLSLCTLDYYLQHVLCELLAMPHSSTASFTHLSGFALFFVGITGLEPINSAPKTDVLTITLYPNKRSPNKSLVGLLLLKVHHSFSVLH